MAWKRKGCAVVALVALAVLGAVASVAVMVSADAPVRSADGEAAPTTADRDLLDSVKDWSAETGGPGLAKLIRVSRDAAIKEGVQPIPPAMRERLSGFFPDTLLDRVRYRVGRGEELSIQAVLLTSAHFLATTLGNVIVFRNADDADTDAVLWAHELAHVQQVDRLGIDGFARDYIRDFKALEHDAMRVAGAYDSWARRNGKAPPITR